MNVHRDDISGEWPSEFMRIGCFVDGMDVNYWKRLDCTEQAVTDTWVDVLFTQFWGFKTGASSVRSFRFGTPLEVASSSMTQKELERPLGKVRIVLFSAVRGRAGGIYENNTTFGDQVVPQGKVNADVKFWKQATVRFLLNSLPCCLVTLLIY